MPLFILVGWVQILGEAFIFMEAVVSYYWKNNDKWIFAQLARIIRGIVGVVFIIIGVGGVISVS